MLGVGIIQFIPKPSEKEAIAYFEPYSDQKMGGKEAKTEATDLLQGDDYFQQKKYTEAIKTWEKITKDSPFREIADFDIALAYVAQKDYKQAELYLKKIASEGGRGKKARELRRKLWLRF